MKPLLIALTMPLLVATVSCQMRSTSSNPSSEVPFVEFYTTIEGEAVSGTPPPGRRIDGPTYTYNSQLGTLQAYINPGFTPQEPKAIVGMGLILRGTEGGGLSSRLVGVNKLPYTEGAFGIKKIARDKMKVEIYGAAFTLRVGKEAIARHTTTDTLNYGTERVIVRRTTKHQVTYHGFVKRSNLQLPSAP